MRNHGLGSWTARRARMSPQRVAIMYEGREWTYRQLHERATRLAHTLARWDVRHGDRVAYLGANHPAFLETLFATGLLGAVFVPLNWRLAVPELEFILNDCAAKVLVYAPEHESTVDALPVCTALRVEESLFVVQSGSLAEPDEPVDPDETCLILYTSGTTGRPKGVMLTHANLTWNSFNLLLDVDLAGDEVTLVAAPMFHVAALCQTVLPTLLKGGRVLLVSAFDPQQALDLIARHGVTFLFGVPTMFLTMSRAPGWTDADLSSVRSAICGGAPVPHAVIDAYQQRGVTFMQGYGLTEAAPGVLFLRRDDSVRKSGSAGTAAFFTDVKLVDATGEPVPAGQPGEILATGPNIMAGYWDRPEDTQSALADGWLHTGDIGVADDEGYIEIRDRTKDMIISGGENIYPAEVEDALYQHPGVAECAVIGVPDQTWGEVGRAVVVLREGTTAGPEELLAFLDGHIAKYKIPKSVVFTDTLPRTTSGKVVKRELRSQFG